MKKIKEGNTDGWTKYEILNRLRLWYVTLTSTINIIEIAIKAENAANEKDFMFSHLDKDFPSHSEGVFISNYLFELSMIYFCCLINSGDGKEGEIARNKVEGFVKSHFYDGVFKKLCLDEKTKEEYIALIDDVKYRRNKIIAHSDGSKMNIKSAQQMVNISMQPSVGGFDFKKFLEFLYKLTEAMQEYTVEIP